MKWIAAILSAGFLVGCGVGVDDPEGLAAATGEVGRSQQAIVAATTTTSSTTTTTTAGSGLNASDPVSAPQDPIPAFEGRTAPLNINPLQPGTPINPPPASDPRPVR